MTEYDSTADTLKHSRRVGELIGQAIKELIDVDGGRRRPEQGHIVNSARFKAALEEFRRKYERGELDV
ncbi:MAG TPA: hypothetical protein VK070_10165 [Acidimicrobiia bacterium]|nr:hypothetical protein [Acidimicrobiia bacterium]